MAVVKLFVSLPAQALDRFPIRNGRDQHPQWRYYTSHPFYTSPSNQKKETRSNIQFNLLVCYYMMLIPFPASRWRLLRYTWAIHLFWRRWAFFTMSWWLYVYHVCVECDRKHLEASHWVFHRRVSKDGRSSSRVSKDGRNTSGVSKDGRNTSRVSKEGRNASGVSEEGRNTSRVSKEGRNTAAWVTQGDIRNLLQKYISLQCLKEGQYINWWLLITKNSNSSLHSVHVMSWKLGSKSQYTVLC